MRRIYADIRTDCKKMLLQMDRGNVAPDTMKQVLLDFQTSLAHRQSDLVALTSATVTRDESEEQELLKMTIAQLKKKCLENKVIFRSKDRKEVLILELRKARCRVRSPPKQKLKTRVAREPRWGAGTSCAAANE